MPRNGNSLKNRWRARRAKLPWGELEAEAARQGCSAADIFFDRAGNGEAGIDAAPVDAAEAPETQERVPRRVPWRGLDPLPASRPG